MVTAPSTQAPPVVDRRRMYELMAVMKATDERILKGVMSGEFTAIYYPHRGQEAIAAALGVALRPTDRLVTTYRGVHDHIGKGVPLEDVFATILGRACAPDHGNGGVMHLAAPESGVLLSTGIVGAGIPVAVGLALASQLDGTDMVTAVCFGDGSTNTGSFHEAINMAAAWNIPCVLVCQNNRWAESSAFRNTVKHDRIADRAAAYGIPGFQVDGNDPDALLALLRDAIEQARGGGGPTLIDCVTFRFSGHGIGDDSSYIPAEEMAAAKDRDPIPRYRRELLSSGSFTEAELDDIDNRAVSTVAEVMKHVIDSPSPDPTQVSVHLYDDATNIPA